MKEPALSTAHAVQKDGPVSAEVFILVQAEPHTGALGEIRSCQTGLCQHLTLDRI